MDRRFVLSGAAIASVGLLASSAFAQTEMAMGAAEQKHVTDTGMVGSLSLATSRLAVKKASNSNVKGFAALEVAEQETTNDVLMSLMQPASDASGKMKKPSDAAVAAMLTADEQAMLEQLEGLSGADFDEIGRAHV